MKFGLKLVAWTLLGVTAAAQAQKFTPADYQKALWMTTRFYGGQRSGYGPNWLLMDHTYKVSYVRDSVDGRDLVGGWMDCGDFPLFGQTFFYSSYVLLQAYDAFPTGFPDQYHGFDYSDYAAAKDFTYGASKPDGIPDLLQEVKYATDWILKATPDANTFYFQKGNGGSYLNADPMPYGEHGHWVTSGYLSSQYTAMDGGELDSSRPILKLGAKHGYPQEQVVNDGSMPSFAAAALALMSIHYRKFDPAYADSCLAHAKWVFDLAKKQTTTMGAGFLNKRGASSFYGKNDNMNDDIVTAAACLYKATGSQTYKDFVAQKKNFVPNKGYTFAYSTNDDAAYYTGWRYAGQTDLKDSLKSGFVDRYVSKATGEAGLSTVGSAWGFLRYPANQAFICGLYARATGDTSNHKFIYNQIDYIMGANPPKQAFIVGFCSGCAKTADWPHHRNVYLNNQDNTKAVKGIPARNKEFGYMLGFSNKIADSLVQNIDNYQQTEGGIDYNAGLVGALAYINSMLNPVDTSKFTGIRTKPAAAPQPFLHLGQGSLEISLPFQVAMASVEIRDLQGNLRSRMVSPGTHARWQTIPGTFVVRAVSDDHRVHQATVVVPR